jgi:nucleoside-diphosphate-sugar epimerase
MIDLKTPHLLVTGGNGWLGKRVVEAALKGLPEVEVSRPARVTCLVPANEDASPLEALGAGLVRGDLRDPAAAREFLREAAGGTLVHLAGIIHPRRVADFEAVNTKATLGLREAAAAAQVKRMVVMSSNSPIGCNPHPGHRFTEESPYHPYMGYGRSKMLMEQGLLEAVALKRAPEIVILRAPWFYGPGQPPRQTLFFSMIKAGKFPIVGDGRNQRSMGYVDNLAQGVFLAAALPQAAGGIFWIADETPYSMNEIITTVGAVLQEDFGMKTEPPRLKVPGLVGDCATLADWMLQTAGLYHQKIHVLSEMNKTIACEIKKAQKVLGYNPSVSLREGMRRSIAWCLEKGMAI